MSDTVRTLAVILCLVFAGCGGGGGGANSTGTGDVGGNDETPPGSTASVSGTVVYGGDSASTTSKSARIYTTAKAARKADTGLAEMLDACADDYRVLWSDLTPDLAGPSGTLNITREATIDGETVEFIAISIDRNTDERADLNIQVSGIPDFEFLAFLNFDTDCDGVADINIDEDEDGSPEINIDENGDGIADYDLADASASSVAGAEVVLTRGPDETYSATTDADGRFLIDGLPTGWYQLEITKVSEDDAGNPLLAWRRSGLEVATGENDAGVYPLDTGPYLDIVPAGAAMSDFMGARSMQGRAVDVPFTVGATASWDAYIMDPNDSRIVLKYPVYTVDGWWNGDYETEEISTMPVPGEPGLHTATITVTLHENHFTADIDGHQRRLVPRFIAGRDLAEERPDCEGFQYDRCDSSLPLEFDWSDVEYLEFRLGVFNDDDVGSFYGTMDGSLSFRMENPAYADDVETVVPKINSVTINGVVHPVDPAETSSVIDLGDVTGLSTLEISVAAEADDPYPLAYDWALPYTLHAYENETSSTTFPVAELPRVYPGALYENQLHINVSYAGVPLSQRAGKASVSINYDVSGGAEPASCDGLSVNGSDGNNDSTLFYVGDTITLQAITSDPKGLPVEYALRRDPDGIPLEERYVTGYDEATGMQYVPASQSVEYTIKPEDNSDSFGFMIFCKNNDGFGTYGDYSPDSHRTEYLNVSY